MRIFEDRIRLLVLLKLEVRAFLFFFLVITARSVEPGPNFSRTFYKCFIEHVAVILVHLSMCMRGCFLPALNSVKGDLGLKSVLAR